MNDNADKYDKDTLLRAGNAALAVYCPVCDSDEGYPCFDMKHYNDTYTEKYIDGVHQDRINKLIDTIVKAEKAIGDSYDGLTSALPVKIVVVGSP